MTRRTAKLSRPVSPHQVRLRRCSGGLFTRANVRDKRTPTSKPISWQRQNLIGATNNQNLDTTARATPPDRNWFGGSRSQHDSRHASGGERPHGGGGAGGAWGGEQEEEGGRAGGGRGRSRSRSNTGRREGGREEEQEEEETALISSRSRWARGGGGSGGAGSADSAQSPRGSR